MTICCRCCQEQLEIAAEHIENFEDSHFESDPKDDPKDSHFKSHFKDSQIEQLDPGLVSAEGQLHLSPIGKPISNVVTYLLDSHLNLVPMGVIGEIYVAGDCLSAGYLNRPDLTASSFIDNPFEPGGAQLYKSGDLARWLPDGNLEFCGRGDHQLKVAGSSG